MRLIALSQLANRTRLINEAFGTQQTPQQIAETLPTEDAEIIVAWMEHTP